jgi:hypothetical protein
MKNRRNMPEEAENVVFFRFRLLPTSHLKPLLLFFFRFLPLADLLRACRHQTGLLTDAVST